VRRIPIAAAHASDDQRINVRGVKVWATIKAYVAVTQVVGKNKHYIRQRRSVGEQVRDSGSEEQSDKGQESRKSRDSARPQDGGTSIITSSVTEHSESSPSTEFAPASLSEVVFNRQAETGDTCDISVTF
jgi:hypothetical protein